jgi:TPR repeat protein
MGRRDADEVHEAIDPGRRTRNTSGWSVACLPRGDVSSEHLNPVFPPLRVVLSDQGDARAQYHLGYKYDTGSGVAQDYAHAMIWYRKAADRATARAMNPAVCTQRSASRRIRRGGDLV